jgi:hypothetical protein
LFCLGEAFIQLAQGYGVTGLLPDDKEYFLVSGLVDLLRGYLCYLDKTDATATPAADLEAVFVKSDFHSPWDTATDVRFLPIADILQRVG